MNNTFSIHRLSLLFRQSLLHNSRLIWLALIGYCGLVIILLLFFQAAQNFKMQSTEIYQALFVTIFIAGGVACAGSSFTSFRSKEKTYTYLMIPASPSEKFAVEFILRVVLFVVLVPILFYLIYMLEGTIVQVLANDYSFASGNIFQLPSLPERPVGMEGTWLILFIALLSGIFIIPFTGSVSFAKNPLIKTMFTLAAMVMINVALIYFFIEIANFKRYEPAENGLLFIRSPENALVVFTWFAVLLDIALLAGAYFKLKEKEA